MATKKLILDLDMGVDDAMALAYAIASPEVELVGITTCFGNVRVEQSAHNCWRCSICWVAPRFRCTRVPTVLCKRLSPIRRRRPPRSFTARTASAARACPRRPTSRWGDLGRRQRCGRLSDRCRAHLWSRSGLRSDWPALNLALATGAMRRR